MFCIHLQKLTFGFYHQQFLFSTFPLSKSLDHCYRNPSSQSIDAAVESRQAALEVDSLLLSTRSVRLCAPSKQYFPSPAYRGAFPTSHIFRLFALPSVPSLRSILHYSSDPNHQNDLSAFYEHLLLLRLSLATLTTNHLRLYRSRIFRHSTTKSAAKLDTFCQDLRHILWLTKTAKYNRAQVNE